MPGFYYYLPGVTKERLCQGELLDRELLKARGLDEVLSDVTHVPKHASLCNISGDNGPDKKSGVLLAIAGKYSGAPDVVTYRPDLHPWHWKPVGDGSQLWIGVLTNALPQPSDLERIDQIEGGQFLDEHGRVWRVPLARSPLPDLAFGKLPQSFTFDDAGEPVGNIIPKWAWLYDLANEIRSAYLGQQDQTMLWMARQAARVLGVNYRLGPAELTLLHDLGKGILTQTTCLAIAMGLIGFEDFSQQEPALQDAPDAAPAA